MSESIPELEPNCGSWIVTRKRDGHVIGEFFSRGVVGQFRRDEYLIETAAQYLTRLNQSLLPTQRQVMSDTQNLSPGKAGAA